MRIFYLPSFLLFFSITSLMAQPINEVPPPYNIKTVSFVQGSENSIPIFQLGDSFQLQFDDLFGNEANYYYEITHCDYNWVPTNIPKNEYLQGFDGQRIVDYSNSFNTLQLYSHYKLTIPNQFSRLTITGNYIIAILDEEKQLVFSRKFTIYEPIVTVTLVIKRARTVANLDSNHNIELNISSNSIVFKNPRKNVKIVLLQNGQWNNAIKNVPPQYTIGNDLIYKYDTETQFWAGNEFLYFDNKDIKSATNYISRVDPSNAIYSSYLYTNSAKANLPYVTSQDVNGNFVVRNLNRTNGAIEADYAWVYFSLSAPTFMSKKEIYITGMFNNYSMTPEYKMDFDIKRGIFEKAVLIKQGFVNYQYLVADSNGIIDSKNAIDGNFFQTENQYSALIYYKEDSDRYYRVIGFANASSLNVIN